MAKIDKNWIERWLDGGHANHKFYMYQTILNYLQSPPKTLLDIGCGLAFESEYFQKEHGTKLYLLEGDTDSTKNNLRDVSYGKADNFKFYNKIPDLIKSFDERQLKYNFVDANAINIPEDVKFDLIYSNASCGFHYPVNTYKNLILKHSHNKTKIIVDLRKRVYQSDIKIKEVIVESRKYIKAEIEFV